MCDLQINCAYDYQAMNKWMINGAWRYQMAHLHVWKLGKTPAVQNGSLSVRVALWNPPEPETFENILETQERHERFMTNPPAPWGHQAVKFCVESCYLKNVLKKDRDGQNQRDALS